MNNKTPLLDQILDSRIPYHQLTQTQRQVLARNGYDEGMYSAALALFQVAREADPNQVPASLEKNIMAAYDKRIYTKRLRTKIQSALLWSALGTLLGGWMVWLFTIKPEKPKASVQVAAVRIDTLWQSDTIYLTKIKYRYITKIKVQKDTVPQPLEYTLEYSQTPQSLFNQPEVMHFLELRNKLPK